MPEVFLRPRPLAESEAGDAIVQYDFEDSTGSVQVVDGDKAKQFAGFTGLLSTDNEDAYAQSIRPLLSSTLAGHTACCFAYGHTNSGKTHTIFGYAAASAVGFYQRAIEDLFAEMTPGLLMQVRFFEVYNGKVYDLLNNREAGHVREDANGVIHVRSETTMGPSGEVKTQSLRAKYGSSPQEMLDIIRQSMGLRAEGTSELHSQSSRSHAVLELEIVTPELAQARDDVVEAQAKVVPIGKARDDLYIAIQSKLYVVGEDGKFQLSDEPTPLEMTARLEELQIQFRAAEAVVEAAQQRVADAKAGSVGGMMVFVDLAGAEYTGQGLTRNAKEQKEAREINSSLLALKECIRRQKDKGHVPFRNSKLTMLLKSYLEAEAGTVTVMVANVSSAEANRRKALDTIKYAALVADAFQDK